MQKGHLETNVAMDPTTNADELRRRKPEGSGSAGNSPSRKPLLESATPPTTTTNTTADSQQASADAKDKAKAKLPVPDSDHVRTLCVFYTFKINLLECVGGTLPNYAAACPFHVQFSNAKYRDLRNVTVHSVFSFSLHFSRYEVHLFVKYNTSLLRQ